MKSGFVGLVGRPNVGKSTLINSVVGEKVSIVSDKPQTTRYKIRSILNVKDGQIIFIDTPGYHKPKDTLSSYLNSQAKSILNDVDVLVLMVDAAAGVGRGDQFIAEMLRKLEVPKILVVNKADISSEQDIENARKLALTFDKFDEVVVTSAVDGKGLDKFVSSILKVIPEGPMYYPLDMVTDNPLKQRLSEIIREKVLLHTFEEVPHAVAVEIEEMKEREKKELIDIFANIYVERESQKGIIIGKKGKMLKKIGTEARKELENILNSQVFLDLRVKVKKNWRKKEKAIKLLY